MTNRCCIVLLCLLVWLGVPDCHSQGRMMETKMKCTLLKGITEREYSVYLPESYDKNPDAAYPVCFLLHGGNCSNTDWETYGQISTMADSLIRAGVMEEMILVCPEGNKNNMIWFNAPHWRYEDFFFQEFIPYIEKTYRVKPGRENRYLAGYSMGGGASVVYGLKHPDRFASVYAMSAYLRRQYLAFLEDDPSAEWRQQLVEDRNPIVTVSRGSEADVAAWKTVDWFIDCGDKDFTYEANIDLVQALRDKGIGYELRILGGGHDWNYWKPCLRRALIHFSEVQSRMGAD